MKRLLVAVVVSAILSAFAGCSKDDSGSSTEDSSTSGSVAAAVGGANSGSTTSGTMSFLRTPRPAERMLAWMDAGVDAFASTACPTFSTSLLGAGEQAYSDCSFGSSKAVWNGGVTFTGTAGVSVTRELADGTTRTAVSGTVVTIDTTGSELTPFNGDSAPSGGSTWTTSSVAINGVQYSAVSAGGVTLFNHVVTTSSLDGGSTLTLSGGTVTGTAIVYHQLARVKATAVVDVTVSSDCCLPTGGTITTTFNTTDSRALKKYNGATEELTFTGCGTATYTGPEGYTGSVTLSHCL